VRFAWICALKDLLLLRRDPFSVMTWAGIPLVIGLLMRLVFGGGDARPQGLLLIADQDQTLVSGLLTGMYRQDPLDKMLTVESVDADRGRTRMNSGDASALLIVPQGFQDAVLRNQPCRLELITSASQRIVPKMVRETLENVVDGAFYLQKVAGDELSRVDEPDSSDEAVVRRSLAYNRIARSVAKYLSPPAIELHTAVAAEKNVSTSDFFFPNMIFMALLMMANGLSAEMWKERAFGTLRRLAVSPAPLSAFLLGRLAAVALTYSAVGLAAVTVARYLAGVTVANLPQAAAWAAFAGTMFFLFLLPLTAYSSAQRLADVRGNLIVFPLMLVGGCFFPFEAMPAWLSRIGRFLPNGLAVTEFKKILSGTASGPHLAAVAAALAAAGAAAFLFSLRGIRTRFVR